MLIVFKFLIIAFAVLGQQKVFPEHAERQAEEISELDTLALPQDHPEWVLARRAIAAEGLCHAPERASEPAGHAAAAPEEPVRDSAIGRLLAESCD